VKAFYRSGKNITPALRLLDLDSRSSDRFIWRIQLEKRINQLEITKRDLEERPEKKKQQSLCTHVIQNEEGVCSICLLSN
jgi:hypothetical protein